MTENLYDTLGVKKEASADQIKKAFKKKAQKLHPDKNKDGDDENTEEEFKQLQKAYHILKDPTRRGNYDDTGQVVQEKSIEQEGWQCICQLYSSILDRNNFMPFDFVKDINQNIRASKMQTTDILSSCESDVKKIQNLIDCTEGSEHLLNILDQRMKAISNKKNQCERSLEVLDMAKTLIDGCEYTGIVPGPEFTTGPSGASFNFNGV